MFPTHELIVVLYTLRYHSLSFCVTNPTDLLRSVTLTEKETDFFIKKISFLSKKWPLSKVALSSHEYQD